MQLISRLRKRIAEESRSDAGFMGYTHALSALGITMMCLAFIPGFITNFVGTGDVWILTMFVLGCIGASMIPDLDNTTSRAKNDLGIFGTGLSFVFRISSNIIQTMLRTKRDDPEPNPHRGFWHTIPAALLLGFLVYLGTLTGGKVTLPLYGEMTWGTVFAMFVVSVLTYLTLSTLFKEFMDKIRKSQVVGELMAFAVALLVSLVLFYNIPKELSFWWLGASVAFGMFIHVFGDCFTTAGAPILFPLSYFIKNKFWWTTRFTKIKAGGPTEKLLFVPIFAIMTCVAFVKIALDYMAR